jgi:ubiquinone/menaquinone biosynthesis C-methylase UbiE
MSVRALTAQVRAKLRSLGHVSAPVTGSASRVGSPPGEANNASDGKMFPEETWFADHIDAARQVIGMLADEHVSLEQQRVADVGTGDGIIALGLAVEGRPRQVVAYDLKRTDTDHLLSLAREHHYVDRLPPNLCFEASFPDRLPADDGVFDVIVSWSCFEHVSDPLAMAQEMRRIVSDSGVLFLQVWPFFYSEHGSHLFDWYQGRFPHLVFDEEQLRTRVLVDEPRPHSEYIWGEYKTLNKLTVDNLGVALFEGGFRAARVELMTNVTSLPPAIAHLPLSDLLINGVKLVAYPR